MGEDGEMKARVEKLEGGGPITKFLDGCGWAEVFCAGTPMRGAPRIAGRAGKVICLARGKAARTAKK